MTRFTFASLVSALGLVVAAAVDTHDGLELRFAMILLAAVLVGGIIATEGGHRP